MQTSCSQIPRVAVAIAEQARLQDIQRGADGGVAKPTTHPHQSLRQFRLSKSHVSLVTKFERNRSNCNSQKITSRQATFLEIGPNILQKNQLVAHLTHLIQTSGGVSGRCRPHAHALAIIGGWSGNLRVPTGIQWHFLSGPEPRLLQVAHEHHCRVHRRGRSRRASQTLPMQRQIRCVRQRDGILLGKHYSNVFPCVTRYSQRDNGA